MACRPRTACGLSPLLEDSNAIKVCEFRGNSVLAKEVTTAAEKLIEKRQQRLDKAFERWNHHA